MNQIIRVAVYSKEATTSQSFYDFLSELKELNYAGKFTDKKELLSQIKKNQIDILIVDGKIIESESAVLQEIKNMNDRLRMIGIFENESDIEVNQILLEEIHGYVLTSNTIETISQAIQVCALGGIYLSENVRKKIINMMSEQYLNIKDLNLSPREKQIAKLYCEGFTYKEIAEKLYISPQTVRTHLKNFHCKFRERLIDRTGLMKKHKLLRVKRNKRTK